VNPSERVFDNRRQLARIAANTRCAKVAASNGEQCRDAWFRGTDTGASSWQPLGA